LKRIIGSSVEDSYLYFGENVLWNILRIFHDRY
jgi:hypothetical protein